MKNEFNISYIKSKSGGFVGIINEIPGIISQGETLKELEINLQKALKTMIEYHKLK